MKFFEADESQITDKQMNDVRSFMNKPVKFFEHNFTEVKNEWGLIEYTFKRKKK